MGQPQIKTDIEARVQDTGDIMTGPLLLGNGRAKLATGDDALAFSLYNDINNPLEEYRQFRIISSLNGDSINYALQLLDKEKDKEVISYNLLHEGNKSLITPNDIGAVNGKNSYLITSFSQLNLSEASISSIRQIVEAMPSLSIGFFAITPSLSCAPKASYGVLKIYKQNNAYASCEVSYSDSSETYQGYVNTGSGAGIYWSGWKKLALFDEYNTLSTSIYTDQSTALNGGIKIHDIRNATVIPGAFGGKVANFYFDEEANGSWKTILDLTGWTAGSYATHQIAFNASTDIVGTDNKSIWHRTGMNGTWNSWSRILDSDNYSTFLNGKYLPLTGGTLTGQIKINRAGSSWIGVIDYPEVNYIYADHSSATNSVYHSMVALRYANHTFSLGGERASEQFGIYAYNNTRTVNGQDAGFYVANDLNFYCSTKIYGAVWNDYAEYRSQETAIQPGYCVRSQRNGKLLLTTERLSPCEGVVSDTFGFAIGETEESQTPVAVSGRVLVYVSGNRDDYEIGDCLCAGPGGLAYKMTREEIKEYPDRIIGTVSEIPEYEIWGTGEISVNKRIWINVK